MIEILYEARNTYYPYSFIYFMVHAVLNFQISGFVTWYTYILYYSSYCHFTLLIYHPQENATEVLVVLVLNDQ